ALAELGAEYRAAEILAPALIEPGERHACRQQAVLRKRLGPPEREIQIRAQPLEVAPHVAALGRGEGERRGGEALRLEDRPQQERAKAHAYIGSLGQRSDPHGGRIRIGGGEVEPEIDGLRHVRILAQTAWSGTASMRSRSDVTRKLGLGAHALAV